MKMVQKGKERFSIEVEGDILRVGSLVKRIKSNNVTYVVTGFVIKGNKIVKYGKIITKPRMNKNDFRVIIEGNKYINESDKVHIKVDNGNGICVTRCIFETRKDKS